MKRATGEIIIQNHGITTVDGARNTPEYSHAKHLFLEKKSASDPPQAGEQYAKAIATPCEFRR
jgi:hypothetical protein